MTAPWEGASPLSRRADIPIAEGELDADLARLVRRTSFVRQGFYCVVLLVALAGQVSGAVETLHIPMVAAIPAVAALELGGIVVLANADVRRRLGERAIASRLLSACIAAWAVAFNWLAHSDHLLGGFFAGMSALGYLVWLMHTENQRRDRLRVKGDLPPTTPAYEFAGHWLRHPFLTLRAKALAKADPRLGLYDSLAAARAEKRRERRESAIAKVLHKKIKSAVDPKTADIAIAVYDLDEIAARLAQRADYDGLTSLIQADLAPERIAPTEALEARRAEQRRAARSGRDQQRTRVQLPIPEIEYQQPALDALEDLPAVEARPSRRQPAVAAASAPPTPQITEPVDPPEARPRRRRARESGDVVPAQPTRSRREAAPQPSRPPSQAQAPTSTLFAEIRRDLPHMQPSRAPARSAPSAREDDEPEHPAAINGREPANLPELEAGPPAEAETNGHKYPDPSLRRRVHRALDNIVLPGDQRDDTELLSLVFDELNLTDVEKLSAPSYVRSWLETGGRVRIG